MSHIDENKATIDRLVRELGALAFARAVMKRDWQARLERELADIDGDIKSKAKELANALVEVRTK